MSDQPRSTVSAPKNWQERVALAEHYLAVGWVEHYLSRHDDGEDRPWRLVTHLETGGSHRFEIETSVWFYAAHPSGLTFRWAFDIEPSSASGSDTYQIDVAGCRRVLSLLPEPARTQFRAYLADCAAKVEAKGQEWRAAADRQMATADALSKAAQP